MENRMTDEDWRGVFDLRYTYPDIPQDDFRIFSRGPWSQNYMVSTEMTIDRLIPPLEHSSYTAPKWFLDSIDSIIIDPKTSSSTSESTTISDSGTTQTKTSTSNTNTTLSSSSSENITPSWSILLVLASIFLLSSFSKKKRKKEQKR